MFGPTQTCDSESREMGTGRINEARAQKEALAGLKPGPHLTRELANLFSGLEVVVRVIHHSTAERIGHFGIWSLLSLIFHRSWARGKDAERQHVSDVAQGGNLWNYCWTGSALWLHHISSWKSTKPYHTKISSAWAFPNWCVDISCPRLLWSCGIQESFNHGTENTTFFWPCSSGPSLPLREASLLSFEQNPHKWQLLLLLVEWGRWAMVSIS